ncbi:MAG: hypothetical protein KA450_06325 [Bacteroidia bacterium]|nr:hypothetical protein [Bacteroidota bacterium]MBP6413044.1 hypothetical protein [Bacteroidia bacterium]
MKKNIHDFKLSNLTLLEKKSIVGGKGSVTNRDQYAKGSVTNRDQYAKGSVTNRDQYAKTSGAIGD